MSMDMKSIVAIVLAIPILCVVLGVFSWLFDKTFGDDDL